MNKAKARKIFKEKRKALSERERMKLDDLILINFQQIQLPFLQTVLSFYPIESHNEINTFLITDYLKFKNPGLSVAYPKINEGTSTFDTVISETDDWTINQYGIPEPAHGKTILPADIDLVLIPMLAFDLAGNRVGYGKGFYDRYLVQCNRGCFKIGLSYFEAVDRLEDSNEFDVTLNFSITPQKVYVF